MPIFDYKCRKCGKTLEILQMDFEPRKLCGNDCLSEGKPGDGKLQRLVSMPAEHTKARDMATGKVDYDDAAKKGFTTYKRRGKGEYEKIAGAAGPPRLVDKD